MSESSPMTDAKHTERCCKIVFPAHSVRGQRCSRKATVEHDHKHYCKQHDPVAVEKKREQRMAVASDYMETRRRAWSCEAALKGIAHPADFVKAARELAEAADAIYALRSCLAFASQEDETDLCMNCPVCKCNWTVRECRVMLDKLAGGCQCGKWKFDHAAALEAFRAAGGGE